MIDLPRIAEDLDSEDPTRMTRNSLPPYEHVVSVSGGKDSTALYLLAMERGRPFHPVFADTGNEHEWTYDFVRDLPRLTGGPEIQWVKADFSAQIAHKRHVVRTKWVREGVPDDIVQRALAILHPTGNPFLDLCLWKGRFPSSTHRFCTEELKVEPIIRQVYEPIWSASRAVISWQGVRADESLARSLLAKWQRLGGEGRAYAYRPLLAWTVQDVWEMHVKHGLARNRLYDHGMGRVGCMPCIMTRKGELREIARRFPEHVERVAEWEAMVADASKRGAATFFATVQEDPTASAADDISHITHGIHRMVEWSKTDRGGRQYSLFAAEFSTACNQWGACE